MKKLLTVLFLPILMTSCFTTYDITVKTKDTFDKQMLALNQKIITEGFAISGTKSLTKNDINTISTFSNYNYHSTTITTDKTIFDTYKYKKENGDEITYTVSYELTDIRDKDNKHYTCVINNQICEYETTTPEDYSKFLPEIQNSNDIHPTTIQQEKVSNTSYIILFSTLFIGMVIGGVISLMR